MRNMTSSQIQDGGRAIISKL